MTPPDICPVCSAEIPPAARACPECGADDTTGWNEDRTVYDGLDLPDDEFNYDEYLRKEFGDAKKPCDKKRLIWAVLIGLAFVVLLFSIVFINWRCA
ncbi:MAG: zinc ribbon domain-containing protein [Kiritimatiellae bacterium]|nr:zinc ribbon domain-containing protein [Kiritimatiellia bacterium]